MVRSAAMVCQAAFTTKNSVNSNSVQSDKPVDKVQARFNLVQHGRVLEQVLDPIARLSPLIPSPRSLWSVSDDVNVERAHKSE